MQSIGQFDFWETRAKNCKIVILQDGNHRKIVIVQKRFRNRWKKREEQKYDLPVPVLAWNYRQYMFSSV